MSTPEHELPPLQEGYEDEFGRIDPAVYQAARAIWPTAVNFGEFALHDRNLVSNLMLKAAASVSQIIATGKSIEKLNAYIPNCAFTGLQLCAISLQPLFPKSLPDLTGTSAL